MSTELRRANMATAALGLCNVIEKGLLTVVESTLEGGDDNDGGAEIKRGINASVNILKSVHETRWPGSIISDTGTPGQRIMRSVGLCLLDVPEIVMCFKVEESDAAMGIFKDLVVTAVDDPEEARSKIFPGRRVIAFRFGRKYYMHDAIGTCVCDICSNDDEVDTSGVEPEGAPIWDSLHLFVPRFRGVQIILAPPEPGAPAVNPPNGPRCSNCEKALHANYKRCPCRSAAYCNRACQKKHWRWHQTTCSCNPSITEQLGAGELEAGVRIA